jgi:uncharacterized GH25 family protein
MSAGLRHRCSIAVLALTGFAAATPALADRMWMLPSSTLVSGTDEWVTVDAAVSNQLFSFDHAPMRLDNLVIVAPDGSRLDAQNRSTSKYRSSFDLPVPVQGTYKIAMVTDGVFASWNEDGRPRRWRGSAEAFAREVPAKAEALEVTQSLGRLEVFVTNTKPSRQVFTPTGRGLELDPVTHPNDLVSGESATFRLLLDGKPAQGLKVTIVPGGVRYRDGLDDFSTTTASDGRFTVKWPTAGMYLVETSTSDDHVTFTQAKTRRVSYATTLEVMTP